MVSGRDNEDRGAGDAGDAGDVGDRYAVPYIIRPFNTQGKKQQKSVIQKSVPEN